MSKVKTIEPISDLEQYNLVKRKKRRTPRWKVAKKKKDTFNPR